MDVQPVHCHVLRFPFPPGRQYVARAFAEMFDVVDMAQERKDIQQIRLFDVKDRKRARNYGRKARKQEVLSDE